MNKVIVMFCMCFLVACSVNYKGSGNLIDNGFFAATERYILNFEEIDVKKESKKTFSIVNLPSENYVFGVDLFSKKVVDVNSLTAVITFKLQNKQGESILFFSESLSNLTWEESRSKPEQKFGYSRSNSYVNIDSDKKYLLTVSVDKVDKSNDDIVTLISAKSGGWK